MDGYSCQLFPVRFRVVHFHFFILLLSSTRFFSKINFFKIIFQEHYWSVKLFESRAGRHFVVPNQDLNCLHMLSADDKSHG